jgi:antitoxin VapB
LLLQLSERIVVGYDTDLDTDFDDKRSSDYIPLTGGYNSCALFSLTSIIRRRDHGQSKNTYFGQQPAGSVTERVPFKGKKVIVRHFGSGVILLPCEKPWDILEAALDEFEPGFELVPEQPESQSNEEIKG